jgi:hypothetical protein
MSNYTDGTAYADNALLGLIRMNNKNLTDWEYSELVQPTQLFQAMPWFPASNGTQHKWTVETTAPTAAFRTLNNGVSNTAGEEKTVTADLKYLDGSFYRDVMLGKGYKKGRGAYLNKETMKSLRASLVKAEYSLIRGTSYDSDGPDGLVDLVNLYNGLTVDAGGTGGSSVYMGIFGEDEVCGILGNDGEFDVSDPIVQRITDESGKGFSADYVDMSGYMCLQVGGKYSLGRIYNLDGTTSHTLTDAMLRNLYFKFPTDVQSRINFILMAGEQLNELVGNRTATNPTGAPAPVPQFWEIAGRQIPIIVSDAVQTDESVVTTTTTTTTTTTAG